MSSPQEIRHQYERGKIGDTEVFTLLMQTVDEDALAELVAWIPLQLLEQVEAYVRYCPRTEECWADGRLGPAAGIISQRPSRRAVEILGDLIGPQPLPSLAPAVLAWNDGCVVKLAWGIHADKGFDRMPILGDALEEAGCDNEDILRHCREQKDHVRGCWVLDLLTRRE